MLQTDRLDEAQKELGGLDRKVQEQAAKVKRAEEEVAKTTADLQSLPPPPEGVNEKKADLQKRLRDLDMQVKICTSFCKLCSLLHTSGAAFWVPFLLLVDDWFVRFHWAAM